MSDQDLEQKVISLVANAVPSKFKKVPISSQTNLQKELGLSSLGMLALVFQMEEAFGVSLAGLDVTVNLASLSTVQDLTRVTEEVLERAHREQVAQ